MRSIRVFVATFAFPAILGGRLLAQGPGEPLLVKVIETIPAPGKASNVDSLASRAGRRPFLHAHNHRFSNPSLSGAWGVVTESVRNLLF